MLTSRTRRRSTRAAAALIMVALVAWASGLSVSAATAQAALGACPDNPGQVLMGVDGWDKIAAPDFRYDFDEIRHYAVDPHDPSLIFVTNGSLVMRSQDGGCHFKEVLDLEGKIVLAMLVARSGRVYAMVEAGTANVPITEVFVSRDRGTTWVESSSGILPHGRGQELVASESDPNTLYLGVDVANHSLVYRTTNGGSSWELRLDPSDVPEQLSDDFGLFSDLAVDPLDADVLWASSGNTLGSSQSASRLATSSDGGRSWTLVTVTTPIGVIDVSHEVGEPARIVAFGAYNYGGAFWSEDGGRTWDRQSIPTNLWVETATHTRTDLVIALGTADTGQRVYRHGARGQWESMMWTGFAARGPFGDLSSTLVGPWIYANAVTDLWRHRGTSIPEQPPLSSVAFDTRDWTKESDYDPKRQCRVDPRVPRSLGDVDRTADLSPNKKRIELMPGESRRVPYTLDITASSIPVDVYFLIDTSGSMGDTVCALRKGLDEIVAQLSPTMPDIYFGVGEYNHYDGSLYGGSGLYPDEEKYEDYDDGECLTPYRRAREIGPPDMDLVSAFARIQHSCGGTEPATLALEESALGDGHDLVPLGPSANDVPPALGAEFRPGAVKVIVHATDEVIQPQPDLPTRSGAAATLASRGVHQIGLAFWGSADHILDVREDLAWVALGTGALAPPGGLDCNGDGIADLSAGEPLACIVEEAEQHEVRGVNKEFVNLTPLLVAMVNAITDVRPVQLDTTAGDKVVASIDPPVYPAVDLLDPHNLDFDVTYRCAPEDAGKTFDVGLRAHSDALFLDDAIATVICLPMTATPPVSIVAAPIAPPPNTRVPQPNPNPNPNPNPQPRMETQVQQQVQSQSQAQAQAVAIPQRQDQPQMALVTAAQKVKETATEHAMISARGIRDPLREAGFVFASAAFSLILAYGALGLSRARSRVFVNARRGR